MPFPADKSICFREQPVGCISLFVADLLIADRKRSVRLFDDLFTMPGLNHVSAVVEAPCPFRGNTGADSWRMIRKADPNVFSRVAADPKRSAKVGFCPVQMPLADIPRFVLVIA